MNMLELLARIHRLELAPVSPGADACVAILAREFPCVIHEYPSGSDYNGWVIPQCWEVKKACVRKDGRLVYDGRAHPLGVIGYSDSFVGSIDAADLRKHCVSHSDLPDAIVYHWEKYYRPGALDWGFSMPSRLRDSLSDGVYDVDLVTEKRLGTMKVAEFHIPGSEPGEILLNAHNCHAGQANDDSSGVVVGIEVMKRLRDWKQRRFGYRLLIAPELFGPAFWLAERKPEERARFQACVLFKAVGNNDVLRVQRSFNGNDIVDRASWHAARWRTRGAAQGAFREIYGNDETVFEAPGFEIPTVTFTRVKPVPGPHYPEYHTSADDMSIIAGEKLEETVDACLSAFEIMEKNMTLERRFEGLVCLGNPRYDLYIRAQDPSTNPHISSEQRNWYMLMTCLPRYLDGSMSILDIADRHNLPFSKVESYLRRFEEKGLVRRMNRNTLGSLEGVRN